MKLTKDLFGVRRGNVHPETIAAGEECPPELEDAARELGCFDQRRSFDDDGRLRPSGPSEEARAQGAPAKKK
jgi:hypothetical protein